jgi:hypothetical protein
MNAGARRVRARIGAYRRTDATRDRHSVGGDAEAALRVPAGVDFGDALAARGAHRAR